MAAVQRKTDLAAVLEKNGILVIDGSMSTALEAMGADLNNKLWTATVLINEPEKVKQVHKNYFKAGADCGITASYQATVQGLIDNGYSETEAEQLLRRSIEVFCEAREEWWREEGEAAGRTYPLCLAGMGPYGVYLADGSEYTGAYVDQVSEEELYAFHRQRAALLAGAGADLLLFETQPSLKEATVAARVGEDLGVDYWISFSCRDGHATNKGEKISDCAAALSKDHPHLKMIGVNCTKPAYIVSLIQDMKKVTDLPIAVYPNSGEVYDPLTKTWTKSEEGPDFGDYALKYMAAGARAVGGCCTTVETHIRQVAAARDRYLSMGKPKLVQL